MTSAAVRRTVCFHGRVQGVGFRATVESIARSFPLTGWVRNESDGSVSCVAEGLGSDLDAFFETILHRRREFIAGHRVEESAPTGEYTTFEVRF